jgi:hypothetical protein
VCRDVRGFLFPREGEGWGFFGGRELCHFGRKWSGWGRGLWALSMEVKDIINLVKSDVFLRNPPLARVIM